MGLVMQKIVVKDGATLDRMGSMSCLIYASFQYGGSVSVRERSFSLCFKFCFKRKIYMLCEISVQSPFLAQPPRCHSWMNLVPLRRPRGTCSYLQPLTHIDLFFHKDAPRRSNRAQG